MAINQVLSSSKSVLSSHASQVTGSTKDLVNNNLDWCARCGRLTEIPSGYPYCLWYTGAADLGGIAGQGLSIFK